MLWILLASLANATPVQLAHQGRVTDTLGNPISEPTNLMVCLYDGETGPIEHCSSFDNHELEDGYYSVMLGTDGLLQHTSFTKDLYVQVSAGGSTLGARVALSAVPTAVHAMNADTVSNLGPADLAQPGTFDVTTHSCATTCTDSPTTRSCGTNQVVTAIGIYSTNGTSPCGNSDDFEVTCCSVRVTVPGN